MSDSTIDVFITNLPKCVSENAIKNLFSSVGKVMKLRLMDDKKFPENKICFVGFDTIDEALEAVRIADRSTAFGSPIRAVVSKRSLEGIEDSSKSSSNQDNRRSNDYKQSDLSNCGRIVSSGRGRSFGNSLNDSVTTNKSVILNDVNLRKTEMLEVEIIDLQSVEYFCARILKYTENSKSEITSMLNSINSSSQNLRPVINPVVGESYLAKWDDEYFYRAELIEILPNKSYRVTFVDEGTTDDIVTELRLIPDGPLEQYPKQFTKLTFGLQTNNDKLKNFIIDNAENKIPKIFWMGYKINGIPLINLFLDDDEIIQKYQASRNGSPLKFHRNLSLKFNNIPNYDSNSEFSDVSINENQFKSKNNFVVQLREPEKWIFSNDKQFLKCLPSVGDICIYEHKTNAQIIPQRCVIIKRHRLTFDIELFDYGDIVKNVSIDSLVQLEVDSKMLSTTPASIHCELESSCDLTDEKLCEFLLSADVRFLILAYLNDNNYRVFVEIPNEKSIKKSVLKYSQMELNNLVGNSYQVYISHMTSPTNFFVQINKSEYIDRLADIQYKINMGQNGNHFKSMDELEVGQAVIAPYSVSSNEPSNNFRATIIEKCNNKQVKVYFIDYGNDAILDISELSDVDDSLIEEPGLCIRCSLNLSINKEAYAQAFKLFDALTSFSEGGCELAMEVLRCVDQLKLIVEITSHTRGVISSVLINQHVCSSIRSNVNTPQKPLCNGDAISVSSRESDLSAEKSGHKTQNIFRMHEMNRNEMIEKILELEQRVCELERLLN